MFARGLQIGAHLHYMLSVSRAAAVEKPRCQGGVEWRAYETSRADLEWADERFLVEQWRERRLPVAGGVCTSHQPGNILEVVRPRVSCDLGHGVGGSTGSCLEVLQVFGAVEFSADRNQAICQFACKHSGWRLATGETIDQHGVQTIPRGQPAVLLENQEAGWIRPGGVRADIRVDLVILLP